MSMKYSLLYSALATNLFSQTLRDDAGRVFELRASGDVRFDPTDGRWTAVDGDPIVKEQPYNDIVVLQNAILHLAEADAYKKRGRWIEAATIWKSILFMRQTQKESPAFLVRCANDAQRELEQLERRRADFETIEDQADPFVFYDRDKNLTWVGSDLGMRVSFPGKYLANRSPDSYAADQARNRIITIVNADHMITIGIDAWRNSGQLELADYPGLWDQRRLFSPQRKRAIGFARQPSELNVGLCWPGRLLPDGASRRACAIYETSSEAGAILEYFETNRHRGIFVGFRGSMERAWLRSAIESIVIY